MDEISQHAESSPLVQYRSYLSAGQLAYQYDVTEKRAVFFPRLISPFGGSLEWRISKGVGTVYASTWVTTRDGDSYSVVLVDLDEGFRMMSNIISTAPERVRIGDRVCVRIVQSKEGEPLPVFECLDRSEAEA